MATVFISYNRQSKAVVDGLASDIGALGHTVWFDQDLSGGQAWWEKILATIRACDVFVFVLDPASLNSTACRREYGYAADLGKSVLPILTSQGVSTNLLPPALSQIQVLDYRDRNPEAALRLARAFGSMPPAAPLPNPLPPSPEVPISYLGGLAEKVDAASTLALAEQSALVLDLKHGLRDHETAEDTRTLLARLRKRRDLFASVAEEIDELLAAGRTDTRVREGRPAAVTKDEAAVVPPKERTRIEASETIRGQGAQPLPRGANSAPTRRQRVLYGVRGGVIGSLIGLGAMATARQGAPFAFGFLTGLGGAVAGAIAVSNVRLNIGVVLGAVLGWVILASIAGGSEAFAVGGVFGAPIGAVVGAIGGAVIRKLRRWP